MGDKGFKDKIEDTLKGDKKGKAKDKKDKAKAKTKKSPVDKLKDKL